MPNTDPNKHSIHSKEQIAPKLAHVYSKTEELANSVSHGVGVIFGIIALIVMLQIADSENNQLLSIVVYGCSIILLFLTSTLYHSANRPETKAILKTLDHSAIYVLIAGTYTPYMLISLENDGGWYYMIAIWSIAFVGISFKLLLGHRFPKISLASYLAMGWFVIIAGKEMLNNVPYGGLVLLAAGGGSYTLGAVFYAWKKLHFNHAIWHLFVLGGAVLHFFSIYYYVLPAA